MKREGDPEDYSDFVSCPYYPKDKQENWWVVIGLNSTNLLLSIKKVTFTQSTQFTLQFTLENDEVLTQSQLEFNIYLISDSYVGAD